jgi:hypothetical protein
MANARSLKRHNALYMSWLFSFSCFFSGFLAKQCEQNYRVPYPKFIRKQERIDWKWSANSDFPLYFITLLLVIPHACIFSGMSFSNFDDRAILIGREEWNFIEVHAVQKRKQCQKFEIQCAKKYVPTKGSSKFSLYFSGSCACMPINRRFVIIGMHCLYTRLAPMLQVSLSLSYSIDPL